MELRKHIKSAIREHLSEGIDDFNKWKRKNVTLRGIKEFGKPNEVYGSFGKGLYTVPLSNKAMAKQYGDVYFVVNAIPKNPKIVQYLNDAEILRQRIVDNFCKNNGKEYNMRFFDENTTMEQEMLKMGYDGLIIKGREMVNYLPDNVKYFKTEEELRRYYETTTIKEYLNEQIEIKDYNKFPLNSLVKFARQFDDFKEFSRWYSIGLNHGYYWHITDNKNFKISDKISPRDMSSMSYGSNTENYGDLMITGDLEYWDDYYNTNPKTWKKEVKRNYVALFDASELNPKSLRQVSRGFGNEIYLDKSEANKLKLIGVYNIEYARKLNNKFHKMIPQSENELLNLWNYSRKNLAKQEKYENVQNYEIVYRGQSPDFEDISSRSSIWVTYDYDFANEYGSVKEFRLPKNLNILDTDYYSEWESLIDEFDEDGDYDEYKYEPTDEFILFLKSKGYDGFMNGDNILIFDKSVLR